MSGGFQFPGFSHPGFQSTDADIGIPVGPCVMVVCLSDRAPRAELSDAAMRCEVRDQAFDAALYDRALECRLSDRPFGRVQLFDQPAPC